jgi:hypothetical protein
MSTMFTIAPFDSRSRGAAACERKSGARRFVLPLALADLAEGRRIERRRVVHERVQAPERLRRILGEARERREVEQIRLHHVRRGAANRVQLGSEAIGLCARAVEVQDHAGARAV